jgi:hypothetical protein
MRPFPDFDVPFVQQLRRSSEGIGLKRGDISKEL